MSASVEEGSEFLQLLGRFSELPASGGFGPAAVDLAGLWEDLASGRWEVNDDFFAHDRCYFILQQADSPAPVGIARARNFKILRGVLLEGGQKRVASDFELSTSTIAAISKQCLNLMGLSPPCSRVSPLLVMAAYASIHGGNCDWHQACMLQHEGKAYRVVSAVRPDVHVSGLLTPAEYSVIRLLVEGRSHDEIAVVRQTSVRTVANQLASAFRRLGVSGRADLLVRLVERPEVSEIGLRRIAPIDRPFPAFDFEAHALRRPAPRPMAARSMPQR